jgi:5-oxoprolinase (ATP-hydrolysing)
VTSRFWIDVGGTFTDCLGTSSDGGLRQFKTLSSGMTPGTATADAADPRRLIAVDRRQDPDGFWVGSELVVQSAGGGEPFRSTVVGFESAGGVLTLAEPCPVTETAIRYELHSPLPAPVIGIRWILGLAADAECPAVQVRLGTTRGTNALLTRSGAKTLLITTTGFADVPAIGNQCRPDLFALNIQKTEPLYSSVLEVEERIASNGSVVTPIATRTVREQLIDRKSEGFSSVAICLMHAWCNDAHERTIADLAREVGFEEISRSSEVSPLIRFVPRCDTTCLDAYLNPVLRTYLQGIQDHLPGSHIQVMTSTGGLVDRAAFRGRDCLLSGPAGGIVGFVAVAGLAGFDRAIGFDMGGTSTDVARFDGAFEYETESVKAGVRVLTSMLAIETVAAGGGSICGFDGVQLFVGPRSAGADPGPACYGAGGPLTVTDLNLFLGRIAVDHFPFPLNVAAVRDRLTELRARLREAGTAHGFADAESLAEGLLSIANDSMVQAIRRISVARGCDPADYALVCFGGAAGQHACSVARQLGVKTVLLHPLAGVLSAWGIGHAEVRAIHQCSVLTGLVPRSVRRLGPAFSRLEKAAIDEVLAQGVRSDQLRPSKRSCLLRYQGTDSAIDAAGDSVAALKLDFESQHRRLFGYILADRTIEIAGLRVEVVGATDSSVEASATKGQLQQETLEESFTDSDSPLAQTVLRTQTWFNGRRLGATVYPRSAIEPGDEIAGPAIICEPTSTTVIDPDCSAQILPSGTVQITINDREGPSSATRIRVAVLLEVLSSQFTSIAEQMGATLRRTAISTNIRERLDFSCAIFDAAGRLVVNAPHVPVHLGAMGETVRAVIADHPDMNRGDVFVTNDPFRGGSHLPDITVVTPVFGDSQDGNVAQQPPAPASDLDAAPACYVANRAHHAEIGGCVPGGMPPFSTTLAEEGILIRSCRLVQQGESCEDALRKLLTSGPYPSRAPDENLADLAAQSAANECGVRLLTELCERHTWEFITDGMKQIQQASATRMRLALGRIPDGEHHFADALDDGTPVVVAIRVQGEEAVVDFGGTGDVHSGNLNANRAITTAAVLYSFRCLLDQDVPLNAGVLEPLKIVIPDGLLNPPPGPDVESSPAIAGGNVETSQRIVDVLFGALELAAASQGTMNNLTFGDDTFGYYETICGGAGATATAAGADAVHTHMTNTRLTDPEILEQRYPVRLRRFAIRENSGGAGRFDGGDGVVREIQFLRPMTVSMLSQRRTTQPYGLMGGEPGQSGRNQLIRSGKPAEDVNGVFTCDVKVGDVLVMETPGGGGYGQPD